MKKKVLFKTTILLIIFLSVFSLKNSVFAAATGIDSIMDGMKDVYTVTSPKSSKFAKVLNGVIKLIQVAGTGISLIVVVILGIKYMLASPGDKADYKKTAIPIVIGCILLFAASWIAGIIADVGNSFN